jgi:tRNA pseudouridine55 synthase
MTQASWDGLIVLDKPTGMTSRAAVNRAARWFPRHTRIGHTGTLDPLATGVLVLCIGKATRLAQYIQQMSKTYCSRFRLGARSDTDDADGVVIPSHTVTPPDAAIVAAHLGEFVGIIEQVPPAYSAAKVMGQRAYSKAREGEAFRLEARQVQIHAIDVIRYEYPTLEVEVRCGKGTYIRSLARDLGNRLGCGAYVAELRRVRVGPFTAESAVPLDVNAEEARSRLLPVEAAVGEMAEVKLTPDHARRFCQGEAVAVTTDFRVEGEASGLLRPVAVFDEAQHLLAVAEYDPARRLLRPTTVLGTN